LEDLPATTLFQKSAACRYAHSRFQDRTFQKNVRNF